MSISALFALILENILPKFMLPTFQDQCLGRLPTQCLLFEPASYNWLTSPTAPGGCRWTDLSKMGWDSALPHSLGKSYATDMVFIIFTTENKTVPESL